MDGQPQVTGLVTNNSNSSSSSGMQVGRSARRGQGRVRDPAEGRGGWACPRRRCRALPRQYSPVPPKTNPQGWAIAIIVIVVLLVIPVPAYFWVRRRKAKRRAAQEQQAAEAAAVRARMESRTGMRGPGGKSFTLGGKGGAGAVDIMVRSGSVGGMGLGYGPASARWGAPREGSMASLANGLPAGGMGPMGAAALASSRGPQPHAGVVPSLAGTAPFAAGIAGAHPLPHHSGAAGDDDASNYSGSEYSSEDESARH